MRSYILFIFIMLSMSVPSFGQWFAPVPNPYAAANAAAYQYFANQDYSAMWENFYANPNASNVDVSQCFGIQDYSAVWKNFYAKQEREKQEIKDFWDRFEHYQKAYKKFCKTNKKADGSDYSWDEWLIMNGIVPSTSNNMGGTYYDNSGCYGTPANNNGHGAGSSAQTGSGSRWHTCPLCKGSGMIVRGSHVATYGHDYKVYCSECNRYYSSSTGHSHVTCIQCHGSGGWSSTY